MKSDADQFRDWEGAVFGYGYGTGEEFILPKLRAFLELCNGSSTGFYSHDAIAEKIGPESTWFLINALCKADIIEYGTSPRYGWLTGKGLRLKKYVLSMNADELVALVCDYDQDQYIACSPDSCNCGPNGYEAGRKCENNFWT